MPDSAESVAPFYEADGITIYHADCMDVLPTLSDIDLIFTSPPYNMSMVAPGAGGLKRGGAWLAAKGKGGLSTGYENHGDAMPWPEYEAWQQSVLTACWATLSDTGAIFYNHKPRPIAGQIWLPLVLNPGLPLRQIVMWARAGGINYSKSHFVPTHEWIMVMAKPAFRLKDKGVSGLGDVWRVSQVADPDHPATFPVELPARAIESVVPHVVLDPFVGSGTTLVAAKRAGCRAIGVDISERYCEVAANRLAQGRLDVEAS